MAKKVNKQTTNAGGTQPKPQANAPRQLVGAARPQVAKKGPEPAVGSMGFAGKYTDLVIVGVIGVLTFLFLIPCLNDKLTNWDDLGYVITNPLIKDSSWEGIKNIFSTKHPVMGNYHPLTIVLYAFEYAHSRLEPWIYHFDSLLLHVLTTLSVFYFVKALSRRTVAAGVAALLFGLHPMHVESVAWIAGRKDVLYGLFFVMSCTAYVKYLRAAGTTRTAWYIAGLVLFALSLLAKSVAVTLPVTLFAIDYLENRKLTAWGGMPGIVAIVAEKLPHFGLALLFGILSIYAQKDIGALGSLDAHFNVLERIALGGYALWNYLWKAVAPVGLSNFYPYPLKIADALPAVYYIYPVIIIAIGVVVAWYLRKTGALKFRAAIASPDLINPYAPAVAEQKQNGKVVLFGLAFFLINIALLLQFIPVGGAIMSDRYGYIPYLGLFYIAGWFVSAYFVVRDGKQRGYPVLVVAVLYCLVLGYMSGERCRDWYDSISLWKNDVEKHPEAPVGYFYLGQEYYTRYEDALNPNEKKRLADSSLYFFNMSVERKPDYINPIVCIAELQRAYNQLDEAKATYYKAMKIKNDNESVYLGLGVVYSIKKQYDSAAICFQTALKLKAYLPEGHSNYANFLDIVGKTDSSLIEYGISIAQNPDAYIPYMNRARIYVRLNKPDQAIADYNTAIQLKPDLGEPHYLRARCYAAKGNKAQALQDVEEARKLGFTQMDPAFLEGLKR